MRNDIKIAVAGATGAVGQVMLSILAERGYDVKNVRALASERSVGKELEFGKSRLYAEELDGFDFSETDYALFSAGGSVSEKYAPLAAEAGAIVIDNTSAFRYMDDIPLVVPEVNPHKLEGLGPGSIIANPNCSTIQMLVALAPIQREVGIERINVATYQSVSGAGAAAMKELFEQTAERMNFKEPTLIKFKQPIAFNVLPQIDTLQDNGYSREEMKMVWETQKIFEDPDIGVNATAVRVPVFYGHSEAVHLETRTEISVQRVRELLLDAPGVVFMDDEELAHPTAATHASGKDPVFVGRLRRDISHPRGIDLWVVADNIRKGAALNAVQIMEHLEKSN